MRQVLYVSASNGPVDQAVLDAIVQRSRHNNALDGITGLLWVDGGRFIQVIEGDDRAVAEAMERIRADDRHRDIVQLHDRTVLEREFGGWAMQLRDAGGSTDQYDLRLRERLEQASSAVRDAFAGLLAPADGRAIAS